MVFIKNADVVKGNGDLRWHTDDGSGGHPVMCPLIQVGIQLDHANADNGQILVLAGSHRHAKHDLVWGEEGDLPVVAIDTEPGDLTVHYGDTHAHHARPALADGGKAGALLQVRRAQDLRVGPCGLPLQRRALPRRRLRPHPRPATSWQ